MESLLSIKVKAGIAQSRQVFNFCLAVMIILLLGTSSFAQKKQMVQIKTFDPELAPYKNVEISVNNKEYITIGAKGVAFVELLDTDFPLKTIKIGDEKLEAASWNYSKGIIEVIIRTRTYKMAQVVVRDEKNNPLANLKVTFKGRKTTTSNSNNDGQFEIPLALDEKIISHDQFSTPDYRTVSLQQSDGRTILVIDPIKPVVKLQDEEPVVKTQSPAFFKILTCQNWIRFNH